MSHNDANPPRTHPYTIDHGQDDVDFRQLIENQSDMVVKIDTQGRFLYVSPSYCRTFGKSREDLLGTSFMTVVHEADREATERAMESLWRPPHAAYLEQRAKTAAGWRWLSWQDTAVLDDNGQIIAIIGVGRDISEQRLVREALVKSEEQFRSIFETMREGFAYHEVICNDAGEVIDYRYLDINPAFEQLTGLKRETTVGWTVREALPGIEEEWIQCFGNVALTGIPDERESYVQDLDRYYRARAYSPEKGKFAVVFEETTAQRRAQRELERREALYNDLVETATDLIWRCDSEGRYIFLNQSWETVFGYPRSEMLGHRFTDFMSSEQAERDNALFAQLLATSGQVTNHETVHLRKDGTPVHLVFNASFYHDDAGQIIGTQGTAHDISARKQLVETLQNSELKYRELVENAKSIILKWDRQGKILFMNEYGQQFFGYSEAELVGRSVMETIVPDHEMTGRDLARLMDDIFASPKKYARNINENIKKDGSRAWISWSNNPIIDNGVATGMFSVGIDITAQRFAEEGLADAHKRLAESETLYRTLLEQSPDGIQLTVPADTRPVYFNNAMHRQLGYSREEYATLKVSDYEELETPKQIAVRIAALRKTGSTTFESVHRTKQGALLNVLVSLRMITISDLPRILAIVRDITEHKQAEEALKDSRERTQFIMNNSPAAIYTCRPSGDFGATYISPNVVQQLGFEPHEFTDDPGFWLAHIHPDDAPRVLAGLLTLFNKGTHSHEYRFRNKDGSWRWMHDELKLVQNEAGEPKEILGCWADITVRKKSEEALAHSHQLMRFIIEHTRSAVAVHDRDLRYVYVSQRYLDDYGVKEKNVIGMHHYEVFPDLPQKWRDVHQRALAGEVVSADDDPYYRDDGSVEWTRWECRPWYASDGSIGGIIVYTEVTTERKKAEDERLRLERQLLHAQKLESLGVLAGGIAHDFNNILTAIIGNAELALMRLNPESPALDNLQRIEKAAARAADLARQMLAYSGKGKFVVEHIDLNRLVEEMGHMLEVSISKKVLLRYNFSHPLPAVRVDATQIRQIVMNLVINASEAIGDRSGVIAITTGCVECNEAYLKDVWLADPIPEGLYVSLEITDTGCGMDKETLAKIFDPFFTTKFTGRGLGMAAVLGIVRGHKGAIKVSSEPGKGSSFKVLLPVGEKSAELFNDIATADHWQGSGTVLLVDDEETVRAIGSEMLKELGFEVITARDGREAVELYKTGKEFRVVILDLTMPHMDGEQCFRELCRIDPDVKVIISSGFSEHDVTQKFVGKELAGYVQKPYKLSELKEVLKRAT